MMNYSKIVSKQETKTLIDSQQDFRRMIQEFSKLCLNSDPLEKFLEKLLSKFTLILAPQSDYGKKKLVHDGVLKCLRISLNSSSINPEIFKEFSRLDENWRAEVYFADLVSADDFTNELSIFLSKLSSFQQIAIADKIKMLLEEILSGVFQTNEISFLSIDLVGSMANNISLSNNSDVDLVLHVKLSDSNFAMVFQKAQDILQINGFRVIEMVQNARVPVMKLEHTDTHMQVDLCINNIYSKFNTELVRVFLEHDVRVRSLILAVKYWAKNRGVSDPKNSTLTSYCWVIMTIFFLQQCQPPVLPVLQIEVSGVVVNDIQSIEVTNTDSLGDLLLKFFLFYGGGPSIQFNPFLQIISIRTKEVYSKLWHKHTNSSTDTPLGRKLKPWWRFCVEDPIELDHDLGSVISRYEGQELIFTELNRAYLIMMGKQGDQRGLNTFDHLCEPNINIPFLPMLCSACESTEHSARYCPQARCHGCGGRGHIIKNCMNKVCYFCRGPHLVSQCPKRHLTGEVAEDYFSDADTYTEDIDVTIAKEAKLLFRDLFQDTEIMMDNRNSKNSSTTKTPSCSSQAFLEEVLNWKVADFRNPKLLSVHPIPSVFEGSKDFFPRFYPFILEEVRAQLEAVAKKNFDGINRYKSIINCKNIRNGKLPDQTEKLLKINVVVRAGIDYEKVKKTGPSFALFVKDGPEELTLDNLFRLTHVMVDMGFQNSDHGLSTDVEFDSTIRNTSIALDLITNSEKNWFLYLLDVGSTAAARICDALGRREQPSFMSDIYSARYIVTDNISTPIGKQIHSLTYTKKLNDSQRNVVENILNVGLEGVPRVQLVKGPPGTGKTSTLVGLLQTLKACGKKVHACAPTNVAVSELARRSLQAIGYVDSQQKQKQQTLNSTDRLADLLLVGTSERLKIEVEDDQLYDILFDARIRRLEEAFENFPREMSSLMSYFHQVESERETDTVDKKYTNSKEEKEALNNIGKAFKAITLSVKSRLDIFYHEAPLSVVVCLTPNVMEAVDDFFAAMLSCDNIVLGKWLSNKEMLPGEEFIESSVLMSAKIMLKSINIRRPKNLKGDVFKEAQLVFSTVNVGGRQIFDFTHFDVTIIDEATQLVQAETCIVLRQSLECLVLVGDDKQLPSTVISQQCSALGYNESLFGRLLAANYPYKLLDVQYRMHPHISRWPRGQFYDGMVVNGENVLSGQYNKEWHRVLPPFALYDIESGEEETHVFGSKFNEAEAMVVRQVVNVVRGLQVGALSVGIISPYSEQVSILQHLETKSVNLTLRVNTVDGFQGQECDIIIFTTVRSNDNNAIGFLKDERRLNVAVTRAKYSLIVVCNVRTLSSDSTWESLINHAKEQNFYYNSSNCPIIKKCHNKWIVSEQRIKDTLSPKSSVFESLPWKVVFNDELRNTIANADIPLRTAVVKAILKLGNGEWPKFELINPLVPDKYKQIIHVHRVLLYRLIWSVDVCQVTCTQILKLWNAILPNMLPQAIQRVGSILNRYSSDYLTRCATKLQSGANYVPQVWNANVPFNWYQSNSLKDDSKVVEDPHSLERSHINNSALLMKFYPLSSAVARLLIAMKSGQNIQLPFVMSKEEESIVRHPGSAFILGRSGTGKTTAILHRMFLESTYSKMLTEASRDDKIHKQLMVTASPILCDAIRRSYNNMCLAASLADSSNPVGICDDSTKVTVTTPTTSSLENDKDIKLPKSLLQCAADYFPLILTYKDLLRLIDNTLDRSFFRQRHSTKLNCKSISSKVDTVSDSENNDSDYENEGTLSMPNSSESGSFSAMLPGEEVDYERFNSYYYPHFSDLLRSESSVVYTEIMSHIKGSLQALHSNKGRLTREEYKKLSQQRQSSLSEKQRDQIYDAYLKYERLKTQEYRDYDTLDVVYHIYSELSVESYKGVTVDSVYVDEVQDLTPAEITLFKFISSNPRGFVFAGDTAQTIAHGVGFRFETVKNIFYLEYLKNSDPNTDSELMPKIWHLKQNFRTHAAVVNIANSIVELIIQFFPLSIDKLEPESSQVHGPVPIFIDSTDNLIVDLFQNNQSCQFGAEQVILVRDDVTKQEVLRISGNQALVLTVLEAKGMEFTDCLVYNFFASSSCGNDWRVIYNAFDSKESCPAFDVQKHNLLCLELKSLYVLITRAKQNLILYDSAYATRQPILSYWKQKGLVELKPLDEDIRSVFQTSSSAEEWVQRGAQLFERKQYSNARLCYQRAGDGQMEKLCHGYELEQEADHLAIKQPVESKKLFSNAAAVFELVVGQTLSVARCNDKAGEFVKAARCYRDIKKHMDAGRCFQAASYWHDAAVSYKEAGAMDLALICCYKIFDFDSALVFLDSAANSQTLDQKWIKKHHQQCTLKAASYYHSLHNTKRMMEFVLLFPTTKEKRLFLKRNNYFHKLLDIEIADKCFDEAARIYEDWHDYRKAAEYYDKAKLPRDAIQCSLRAIRLHSLDVDYMMTAKLSKEDSEILYQLQESLDVTSKEEFQVEIDLMLASADETTSLAAWKSLCQKTKSREPYSWRLHYSATRLTLHNLLLSKSTECVGEYCREFLSVLDQITPCLERLKQQESCQLLSRSDKEIVTSSMKHFELTLEGKNILSKNLVGPSNMPGLPPVFQIVNDTPGSSNSNIITVIPTVKITVKEFSQCVLKYFGELRKRAILETLVALNVAYRDSKDSAISMTSYNTRLQTAPSKRGTVSWHTSTRFQLLLDCHRIIQSTTHPSELSKHPGHKKLRADLVDLLVNSKPRLEDIDQIASARNNKEVLSILRMYLDIDLRQTGLKYNLIALSLHLAEITGDTPRVAEILVKNVENELKKHGKDVFLSNCVNYVILRLIHAYQWECADYAHIIPHCPEFIGGSYFFSIKLGILALTNEINNGEIKQICSGKPIKFLQNGCFSPQLFLQLIEKYFVLLLCHLKRFRDVFLPYSLAKDVLCHRSKACGDAIRRYSSTIYYQENTSPYYKVILNLLYSMIALLENINETDFVFDNWESGNSSTGTHSKDAVRDSLQDFVMRVLSIIIIYMCNQHNDKINNSDFFRRIYQMRLKHVLPHFFQVFLHNLTMYNVSFNYTKFCDENDHKTPLLLHCIPTTKYLPSWCTRAKKYPLIRAILAVGDEDEVMIVPPLELHTSTDMHTTSSEDQPEGKEEASLEENPENIDQQQQQQDSSTDQNSSVYSVAPTLVTKLTAEEKVAKLINKYLLRLKSQLIQARIRLGELTPLSRLIRVVEKELIEVGWSRVSQEVIQYTSLLCPYRLQFQEWYNAVDNFIQEAEVVAAAKTTKLISEDSECLYHAEVAKEILLKSLADLTPGTSPLDKRVAFSSINTTNVTANESTPDTTVASTATSSTPLWTQRIMSLVEMSDVAVIELNENAAMQKIFTNLKTKAMGGKVVESTNNNNSKNRTNKYPTSNQKVIPDAASSNNDKNQSSFGGNRKNHKGKKNRK